MGEDDRSEGSAINIMENCIVCKEDAPIGLVIKDKGWVCLGCLLRDLYDRVIALEKIHSKK